MTLFDVVARITLDSSDYEEKTDSAEKKGKSLASKLGSGLKTAAKVGVAALGAVTAAAGTVVTALAKGVQQTAEYGDNIDKMSQKMGMSASAYQEWDAIMQHSGTSIESLQAGMKTLANAVESGNDAFARLGISQEQIASMSQEELFSTTISSLQNISNETERTYLAGQLLGRGATELGALLNMSAEKTDAMRRRVHELGGVMSDDAVKAAATFQDKLQDLTTTFSGLKRSITAEFLPGVNDLLAGFTSLILGEEGAETTLKKGLDSILGSANVIVPKISSIIASLGNAIISALPQVLEIGLTLVESLGGALLDNSDYLIQSVLDLILTAVQHLADGNVIGKVVDAAFKLVNSIATWLGEYSNVLIEAAVTLILQLVQGLTDPSNLVSLVESALFLITSLAQGLIDALPTLLEQAPVIIENLITGLLDSLPLLVNSALFLIQALVQGISENADLIIGSAVSIIGALLGGLLQALPELLYGGIAIVLELVAGIGQATIDLVNAATQLMQDFADEIANKAKDLIEKGRELVDNVKNGVMQKIEDAKNWGRDLINNFVGGIKQKWENLKTTVSNVAGSIKSFLGFSEPEEGPLSDFHTYAPDMMELFAKGVRDNAGMVQDEIGDAFDFAVPELTATVSADAGKQSRDGNVIAELRDVLGRLRAIEPGTLVGMIAPDMDAALGSRQITRARGLA